MSECALKHKISSSERSTGWLLGSLSVQHTSPHKVLEPKIQTLFPNWEQ